MTATAKLYPAPGLIVAMPNGGTLPAEGLVVELTNYWRRRLISGDVTKTAPKGSAPTSSSSSSSTRRGSGSRPPKD